MIRIDSASYPIFISDDIVDELSFFIENNFPDHRLIILVDENTEEHCLPLFSWYENQDLKTADTLCIPVGEESKNIEIIGQLAETLIELGTTRKALILNLGGGVVSDLGGFLAATFKRGIPFINIPTTLLAMVDASTGGKTGVNVAGFKNQLGAFYFPEAVFCGLQMLKTLPKAELKSGYAEALKHGLIADAKIWYTIQEMDLGKIPSEEFVANSIRVKNEITERDPLEKGERKKLNFGHTIGHALESWSHIESKPRTHGEAVAQGMIIESFLSLFYSKLPKFELDNIVKYLLNNFDYILIDDSVFPLLLDFMFLDKKNEEDGINFTLLNKIGDCDIDFILSEEEVTQALEWYISLNYNQ